MSQKSQKYLWPITAFGAGTLLTLVGLDFLPHAFEKGFYPAWIWVLLGFLVNALAEMFVLPRIQFLNRYLHKNQKPHKNQDPHIHYHFLPSSTACSALACLVLCAFFDGLRLGGAVLTQDFKLAMLMGLSLLFHLIPESSAVLGIGLASGLSKKALLRIVLLFCLSFLVGYQAVMALSHIAFIKDIVLPFASGLFLFICCVHLIPMTFKLKLKKYFCAGALLCFLSLWLSGVFFGHFD